jgi:nitrogen fixation NifU-like protein
MAVMPDDPFENEPAAPRPGEPRSESGPSEAFLVNAMQPHNLGFLPQPDGLGAPVGSCGDSLEIGIQVTDDVISRIAFFPQGCAATVAVGSAVTQLALGLSLDQAQALTAADVAEFLGGLPPGHGHCAKLGIATLRAAIRDYLRNRNQPWRKMYRPPTNR